MIDKLTFRAPEASEVIAPKRFRIFATLEGVVYAFLCPKCWYFFQSTSSEVVKMWARHHDAKECCREATAELGEL